MIDLALLRKEAELLKADFDAGEWIASDSERYSGQHPPKSNPGAVAERCIALIEEVESRRENISECRLFELRLVERMIAAKIEARYPGDFYRYVEAAIAEVERLQAEIESADLQERADASAREAFDEE